LNFRNLARYLRRDQPFYGIQAIGLDSKQEPFTQIEDMARHYVQEIRKSQPVGPYYLGGYSMGGIVAFEMTRQLRAEGDGVDLLALIDTYSGPARSHESFSQWLQRHWAQLSQLQFADLSGYLAQRWRNARVKAVKRFQRSIWAAKQRPLGLGVQKATTGLHMKSVQKVNKMAVLAYRMQPLECDAVLFKGELQPWDDPDLHDGWNKLIQGTLEIRTVSGRHGEIMIEPHVRKLAYELTDCLERRYARRPA